MGLTCIKADGGATYANVTDPGRNITLGEADAVPPRNVYEGVEPGGCVVYKWMVEEDSGPDEGDPSKVSFLLFPRPLTPPAPFSSPLSFFSSIFPSFQAASPFFLCLDLILPKNRGLVEGKQSKAKRETHWWK